MAGTARSLVTAQDEDFPRWYRDVVVNAGLAEPGPAPGTTIVKPWGHAILERIRAEVDTRIRATGAGSASFPLLVPPALLLQGGAGGVDGAAAGAAVVSGVGDHASAPPLAVRRSAAPVVADARSRWIQGHRDLPLRLSQWTDVACWELCSGLLPHAAQGGRDHGGCFGGPDAADVPWQEGCSAHATAPEAAAAARRVLAEVYVPALREVLAIPVHAGRATPRRRVAGAQVTYTLDALLRDGRALRLGASSDQGSNLAQAFGIRFLDQTGHRRHAHTSAWTLSARTVGGLVMTHGDDRGLCLPPLVAPVQAVVLAVKPEAAELCDRLAGGLASAGVRVERDTDTTVGSGRRAAGWEVKGVPVRIEIGPRDLAARQAMVVRRDRTGKQPYPLPGLLAAIPRLLEDVQQGLLAAAQRRRDAMTQVVGAVADIDGAGSFLIPWDRVGDDGEAALAERGFGVRCLLTRRLATPGADDRHDLLAWVARGW